MDIKDSYLHSTVGVVKSIDVEGDKLKYNLADKNNTEKTVILPLATQETNGLLSKEDKIIIDSVSELLANPHYLENSANNIPVGWVRIFSGSYQDYGLLSIKHGNVKLTIDFINNYSSDPYLKYINGIPIDILSKIRFIRSGNNINIDIYNNSVNTITVSFYSNDIKHIPSLSIISVTEDVSSYTVYEYDLQLGNWSNMPYKSSLFIGDLKGTADISTKLGTNTLGSINKPIYLNQGVPTECSNVISSDSILTDGNLLIGNSDKNIKPLTNGTNNQVMTMVAGKPTWANNIAQDYSKNDTSYKNVTLKDAGWVRIVSSGLNSYRADGGKLTINNTYNSYGPYFQAIDFSFRYSNASDNPLSWFNCLFGWIFTKIRFFTKNGVNYLDLYYPGSSGNQNFNIKLEKSYYNNDTSLILQYVPEDDSETEGFIVEEYDITQKVHQTNVPYKAPEFIGKLTGTADKVTQSETTAADIPFLLRDSNGNVKYNTNFSPKKFNEYLPKTGGTMSGDVDMGGNEIKNTNLELVESLPTGNLYEGRQVTYDGKIYTYHNGKWISTADDLGDLKEILPSEFIFRPTADAYSVKDEFASVRNIKGNTIVWNQLNGTVINYNGNGITQTQNEDGTFTLNGTATQDVQILNALSNSAVYTALPIGHKGLFIFKHLSGEFDGSLNFQYGNIVLSIPTAKIATDNINYRYLICHITEGCIINNATFSFQLFDLTKMFGEGNEPTSVEEFEKLYSHLPADYNKGSLLNLNADSIKSVGFNQFNKNNIKINTSINSNGTDTNNTLRSASSFIRVLPNTDYYVKGVPDKSKINSIFLYDVNKNILRYLTTPSVTDGDSNLDGKLLFTTTNDEYYIRICFTKGNENNVCLNFSYTGEKNGEYEPYEEHIVNLPIKEYFPDGMKSAGTAYDEIVFDKNIGKYKAIQRIGSVDLGTLSWRLVEAAIQGCFITSISNPKRHNTSSKPNAVTVRYMPVNAIRFMEETYNLDKVIDVNSSYLGYDNIVIRDTSYTDVASFKASLQGQILYYELETPIETIIEDYDLIAYKANDWGTEEVLSEEPTTPIKADIEYNFDSNEIIKYNYFRIDDFRKNYLRKDETAVSAEKLARPVKLWGNNFDGSYDVNGIINYALKVNNIKDQRALLNIESVVADVNYSHLYVTCTNGSNPVRPLVLLNGYGNVGIGLENPTEKLEVLGNVKATSFKGNLDGTYINKLTNYTKATSIGSISTTDTLNTALGKLEYKTDFIYNDLFGTDNDEIINKWNEVVDFIGSITEGTDITDLFVTKTTNQTITGLKTFSNNIILHNGTEYAPYIRFQRNSATDNWYDYYIKGETGGIKFDYSSIDESFVNMATISTIGISASKFITAGGTSDLFVKGNGSLDSNSYLKTTGGTITGGLISYGNFISINDTSRICILAGTNKNWIQSGNSDFSENKDLYISGPNTQKGSNLYLKFENIYSRNNYINLDSGNYNTYSPKLDGTGATGNWDINITGIANTAKLLQNPLTITKSLLVDSPGWYRITKGRSWNGGKLSIDNSYYGLSSRTFIVEYSFRYLLNDPYYYVINSKNNHKLYEKLRFVRKDNNACYLDLYINSNNTTLYCRLDKSSTYTLSAQDLILTKVADDETLDGYEYKEYELTDGIESNLSFTSSKFIGNLTGIADSATKLSTSRKINLIGGVIGETTFDGSKNVELNVTEINDSVFKWTGTCYGLSPIAAGLDGDLGGNVLSFVLEDYPLEYSNDAGNTWIDYGATLEEKVKFITSGLSQNFLIGKKTSPTINDRLRITVPYLTGCIKNFIVRIYKYVKCTIESKGSDSSWTIINTIEGGDSSSSGHKYLSISTNNTYNNTSYTYRLTFESTQNGSVYGLYAFSNEFRDSLRTNTLTRTGHLYLYDWQQNVIFPNTLSAKSITLSDNKRLLLVLNDTNTSSSGRGAYITYTSGNSSDQRFNVGYDNSYGGFLLLVSNDSINSVSIRNDGKLYHNSDEIIDTDNLISKINSTTTPFDIDISGCANLANKLKNTIIVSNTTFKLHSSAWTDSGYTTNNIISGTYAIQITSENLIASGIMSILSGLSENMGDEIPLHVYGTAGWRPYLRTYSNKILISSNDIQSTNRTVTIKIAQII